MVAWTQTLRFTKDPYTEEDYVFEWGDWLNGANIQIASVTSTDINVAFFNITNSNQDVTCRIAGGTDGNTKAGLSCSIDTDDVPPRKINRSVMFLIKDL